MKKFSTVSELLVLLGKFLYLLILPLVVFVFLLLVSENISRPLFSGSKMLDFVARLWLCLIFSMGYIIVVDLERYKSWFYGRKIDDSNSKVDNSTIFLNIIMSIIFGVFAALITMWAVRTFLPIFSKVSLIVATINGILYFVPMFCQRKHFRF